MSDDSSKLTDNEFREHLESVRVKDASGDKNVPIAFDPGSHKLWNIQADTEEYIMNKVKNDPVNHPAHYTTGTIEVVEYIMDKNLNYNMGNVIKYVSRADHKGNAIEDLKKARAYLNFEIARREAENEDW